MARIRSIKPEFWTNERVMECSIAARLFFIGMWNFADDLGRIACSTKSLKAQIFPSDDMPSDDIRRMIDELSTNGLVLIYEVDGREFIQITGWQHQKIDRPQAGKCPSPVNGFKPTAKPELNEHSSNDRRPFATDRIGEEGKGEDSSEANASGADAPPDPSIAEREFFARGREVLGKSAGGQLAKLKAAKGGNVALARSCIETASTKDNPGEYVAAAIKTPIGRPLTAFQQRQQETNDVRAGLQNFANGGGGSGPLDSFLPKRDGGRPENLRGGAGPTVLALPRASGSGGDRSG